MRQILVDHARSHRAAKRQAPGERVALDEVVDSVESESGDLLALNHALHELSQHDPRATQVVELRLFVGLSVSEVSSVIDQPRRTVERDWTYARTWLKKRLGSS